MKPNCLFLLLALPVAASAQESSGPLELSGSFERTPLVEKVIFMYDSPDGPVRDTLAVSNGRYAYRKTLPGPVMANVVFRSSQNIRQWKGLGIKVYNFPVYLMPGKMALQTSDSVQHTVVTGSPAHDDYQALQAQRKPYDDAIAAERRVYSGALLHGDSLAKQAAEARIDSFEQLVQRKVVREFIAARPSSPLALNLLMEYSAIGNVEAEVEELYARLPKATRESPQGKELAARVAARKATRVGAVARDLSLPDTLGRMVSLASFRGKYVLVDFWASWCGPCRAENPNVVAAYEKYRSKNFVIVGVSLDEERADWLKAIAKDRLNWPQLSDLKGWQSVGAVTFGVESIPFNLLLDPEGRIVARGLRGPELHQKLAELLKP